MEAEYFARLGDGRDYRVVLNHYPDRLRLQAVVTIVEGARNGQTIVVPVSDLRPDFTALPEPGEGSGAWAAS